MSEKSWAMLDAEKKQKHYPHTTIKFPYNPNRDTTEKRGDFLQHEVYANFTRLSILMSVKFVVAKHSFQTLRGVR